MECKVDTAIWNVVSVEGLIGNIVECKGGLPGFERYSDFLINRKHSGM